jgi:hypothetical protein
MTHLLAQTITVPVLEGVTTAIVFFIFACVLYPTLVKNKTQFYAAFAAVLLVILLHSLNTMIGTPGFQVFAGATTGILQVAAILLLFSAAGGLSVKELAGEMARAYEVMRRGDQEKTVIVPLTGEMPKPRQDLRSATGPGASVTPPAGGEAPEAEKIDLPPDAGWPTKKPDNSSIPLE